MHYVSSRNVVTMLIATGAWVVLGNIQIRAMWRSFEVDQASLFSRPEPLWSALACVALGVVVGIVFVERRNASMIWNKVASVGSARPRTGQLGR